MAGIRGRILWTLFVHLFLWCSLESINENSFPFYCDDLERIDIQDYCDSINDCEDSTDEKNCTNEALLIYSTSSSESHLNSKLNFVFLRNEWEFAIDHSLFTIQNVSTVLPFGYAVYVLNQKTFSNGSQLSILQKRDRGFVTKHDILFEFNGQGTALINDIALDWIGNNFYMIIVDNYGAGASHIQVCDNPPGYRERPLCVFLKYNVLMKRPVKLAVSSTHRSLFWIEKKSNSEFSIVKSSLLGFSASEIQSRLTSPRYLTVDIPKEKLYWLDGDRAYSVTFDGTEKNMVAEFSEYIPSFGVNNDTLYWIYSKQKAILTCNWTNCSHPVRYRNVSDGYPIAVFSVANVSTVQPPNACKNSTCSNICIPTSDVDYSCVCGTTDDIQLEGTLSTNLIFCEETTLLATDGLYFFVIANAFSETPRLNSPLNKRNKLISAFSYNSAAGTIIWAPSGQPARIYSLDPKDKKEKLLLSTNFNGSISSLEFDDFGNNVYWISPDDYAVKVSSLRTLFTTTLWQGNSSYIPLDIALAPNKGFMFLAFLKNKSTISIERHAMDGLEKNKKTMYKEVAKMVDIGSILFHYIETTDTLFVSSKFVDTIACFEEATDPSIANYRIQIYTHTQSKSALPISLTSLGNYIFWHDTKNALCWVNSTRNSTTSCTSNWPLPHLSKITNVRKFQGKQSPCHKGNGGCHQLCLASSDNIFTCACGDDFFLDGSFACSKKSNNSTHMVLWFFIVLGLGIISAVILYAYRIHGNKMFSLSAMRDTMNNMSLLKHLNNDGS